MIPQILMSVNTKHKSLNKPLQVSNSTSESKHEQAGPENPNEKLLGRRQPYHRHGRQSRHAGPSLGHNQGWGSAG